MKKQKKLHCSLSVLPSIVAVVAFFVGTSALAGDCESIRPELMERALQMAQNARDMEIKDFSEASAATLESGYPGQSGGAASSSNCLEKYKNVTVGGVIGIPNVGDISSQALDRVSQAACTSIDSIYNQAAGAMEQAVMLPGTIGNVQVSLPNSSQLGTGAPYQSSAVSIQQQPSSSLPVSQEREPTPNYIKGIFQ